MAMTEVTDPAILAQLNAAPTTAPSPGTEVTDPKILEQLNATQTGPGKGVQAAANIGFGTAIGTALGAASPEIVSGLGALSFAIPGVGEVVGPLLIATGRAMRAGRVAEALAGAVSGAVGSSAEEAAKAAGATEAGQTLAGVGGSMLTPGATAIAKFLPKAMQTGWAALNKFVSGTEASLESAVKATRAKLAGDAVTNQPLLDVHATLQKAAESGVIAAEKAAVDLESKAHQQAAELLKTSPEAAQRVIADAKAAGEKLKSEARNKMLVLDKATEGKAKAAERIQKLAATEQAKIGQYREISDIGKDLRGKVTAEQEAAIKARQQADAALRTERDQIVAGKEASGAFLDAEPGMKSLKAEISRKLLLTTKGREAAAGRAEVTEPGVMSAYQKIWDAVNNRRVQTGVNASGNPTFETFKTSFEALDHVRRKLGDALKPGAEKEGYGALGQKIAGDMYAKISQIQKDYVGPVQEQLQAQYHGATTGLTKFGTSSGKKMTAVDRIDPDVFAKDPKGIPTAYFNSQQGVKDLVELTGDPTLVERAASDYALRQISGMDAKQTKAWLANPTQTDWMREVPGLQAKVSGYAEKLGKIETGVATLESRQKALQVAKRGLLPEAEAKAAALHETGLKEATARAESHVTQAGELKTAATMQGQKLVTDAKAQAQKLAGNGFPATEVRKLLTSGDKSTIEAAFSHMAGAPGGKAAIEGAIRNVLSSASLSPGKLKTLWEDQLSVALKSSGVLPPAKLSQLNSDVQQVLLKETPAVARTKLQQMLNAAIVAGGRAASAGEARVPDQVPLAR